MYNNWISIFKNVYLFILQLLKNYSFLKIFTLTLNLTRCNMTNSNEQNNLGFVALVAIVMGSMIAGGIFDIPQNLAEVASPGAILIGWLITGVGIIALALAFQNLSDKRPDLEGGIYSYAKEGFGNYMGFNSAYGYWLSALLGQVFYVFALFQAVSYFFPVFAEENTVMVVAASSALLWATYFMVKKGISSAVRLSIVTTIGKIVPLIIFIIVVALFFNLDNITMNMWGEAGEFSWDAINEQVRSTMLITLWVFIGVEGAVVLSGRAKNKKDVGRATITGLIGALIIYVLVSMLSLGAIPAEELATYDYPSTAYIMEDLVGTWGAVLINAGMVISLVGAWLGWTLLAVEIPTVAAEDGVFPKFFAKKDENGNYHNALLATIVLIQLFLFTKLFSTKPYDFMMILATSAILIPYLFSALYQVKYTWQSDTTTKVRNMIIGVIATIYAFWLVFSDIDYLILSICLYVPGILMYRVAQKENGRKLFNTAELVVAIIFILVTIYAFTSGLIVDTINSL